METRIKLKRLELSYFKGIRSLSVSFFDNTVISGRNTTGKTTIFDAWSWLLFGKDSLGNTDFEIKTLDENGNVIHHVDHEVCGYLEVNGEQLILKRVLHENWTSKGEEQRLKGNETRCFIDGVPITVTEYQKRISEIVDENLFRLITNINYFHSLKRDERRNILISLAGEIENEEIIKNDDDLKDIVEMLNKASINDLKRKISAEKKRINSEIADIKVRIDEQIKGLPEGIDFDEIQKQLEKKKEELSAIEKLLSDRQELVKKQIDEANEKRKLIGELRGKQQEILIEAELEATRVANEKNKNYYNFEMVLEEKLDKVKRLEKLVTDKKRDITDLTLKIDKLKKERERLVVLWKEENAKQLDSKIGCLICPLYNHECSDVEALRRFSKESTDVEAEFNARKMKRLSEINEEGLKIKNEIEEELKNLETLNQELLSLESNYKQVVEEYDAFAKIKPEKAVPEPVVKENIREWVELERQISSIKIEEVEQDNSDIIAEKERLNREILDLSIRLDSKKQIEKTNNRINELQQEQRRLAQSLSEQEEIEYKLMRFNKLRMEEVDRRVNDKFRFVRFKLFDTTLDGNEYETCETLIDGVPYWSANNAGRILAGLDIIQALQKYFGVYAPCFVDNSEAVNSFPKMDCQMIYLRVTDDDKLVISEL
ncbi:MAG TPA: AAA family ATPase [Candidatus Kapabacteria bacterium]|nr:AAA family ATPase [Candidatus Kapabacteria bacterium]